MVLPRWWLDHFSYMAHKPAFRQDQILPILCIWLQDSKTTFSENKHASNVVIFVDSMSAPKEAFLTKTANNQMPNRE